MGLCFGIALAKLNSSLCDQDGLHDKQRPKESGEIVKFLMQVLLATSPVFSFANIADRAYSVAEEIERIEDQLTRSEKQQLREALRYMEQVLGASHGPTPTPSIKAICISNGEFGGFEKFAPYIDGQVVGRYTSRSTCETILKSGSQRLLCASNGEFGGFEKFAPYDLRRGALGGYTSFSTCQRLLQGATRSQVCISNGEFGGFEKFALYDRQSQRQIGGWTSFQVCMSY